MFLQSKLALLIVKMKTFALLLVAVCVFGEDVERKPIYKYRYETEESMKTAASSVPVRGYHVVEGGYYPESSFGFGRYTAPSYGGFGPYSGGGYEYGGYPGGFGGYFGPYSSPYYGGYHGFHSPIHGGEYVDRSSYGGDRKASSDGGFEKSAGAKSEEVNRDQEGYTQGRVAVKNNKGDSGFYNDEAAAKKAYEDGKQYHGAQHAQQEGKNADEKKGKSGHKKGHIVKGFKTSHHKDESGKTEEYFDEANDEGGNYYYNGKSGSFGENAGSAFKGGHANDHYNAEQKKKQGHYDNQHSLDNSNADKGQYGEKKYYGNGQTYGTNNGVDQQSLLGHQENSRFYKNHPYHVPFYHQN